MEKNKLSIFLNGFIKENPILVLILGLRIFRKLRPHFSDVL